MPNLQKVLLLGIAITFAACSKSEPKYAPAVPNLGELPPITRDDVPAGTVKTIKAPRSNIQVMNVEVAENAGKLENPFYLELEGTLARESYALVHAAGGDAALKASLEKTTNEFKRVGAILAESIPEAGYFKVWFPYQRDLSAALKDLRFTTEVYINPVHVDTESFKTIKAFTASKEGFRPRGANRDFSGLSMMRVPEFIQLAEPSLGGQKLDGSSVKLGITDTGITIRHPSFLDRSLKKSRVIYMKDFTREGRVYFNPEAKFEAKLVSEKANIFSIDAELIVTKPLPEIPSPDPTQEVKGLKVRVSDELKALMLDSKNKVLLGVLMESSLQGEADHVDLNANGKLDDQIPMILVTTEKGESKVFVDFNLQNDFTKSPGLRDFNESGDTVKVFAESIGFHIQDDRLKVKNSPETVNVKSVSIVGYDPGNHGSHVAGIAAGRKTISNDSDDTLARGAAPYAQILMNRVCANNMGCNATEAIIDLALKGGAEVINMSLGGLTPFNDGFGVQETIINRLTSRFNVLFVISAGNSGPGRQTVGSPSVARLSLSVGAAASRSLVERQYQYPGTGSLTQSSPQDDEFMLFFSSRGPTAAGGFKPNIAAPGTELSAVQMNAAPGHRAGLDVYWGTSMAAPSATGAYALLVDAIKKFNQVNADQPITTDAMTIRQALIQSARKFGSDQYTWMDQGTGMIDLVSAWKLLLALRSETLDSGVVNSAGKSVRLDYEVITSIRNPHGQKFDGSRPAVVNMNGGSVPAFGSGIYLAPNDDTNLFPVHIARRLPESLQASDEAGDLTVGLVTSAEEFVLRTDYGRDDAWLKVGVRDEMNCEDSETENLRVLGRGTDIKRKEDGTGEINVFQASTLFVCVDRAKLRALSPGDHGALIYAFRTDGKTVSQFPSFIVPVAVNIPHQTLAYSTAYDVFGQVKSFQVARNYVVIPEGAKLVKMTLEVPAIKAGEMCSGVELMALEGGNTLKPKETRAQMRIANCDANGAPEKDAKKRQLVLNRVNPKSGVWDLHVFGQYRFKQSDYRLRVDYLISETSVNEVAGGLAALNGSLSWKMTESSLSVLPSTEKSKVVLSSLSRVESSEVKHNDSVIVEGAFGIIRKYPAGAKSVTISTYGSKGNDIDLNVIECTEPATEEEEPTDCGIVAQSGGSTDEESATFTPKEKKIYAVQVAGYEIKDEGKFQCEEEIALGEDLGSIAIAEQSDGSARVDYSFTDAQVQASKLLNDELVKQKIYNVKGVISLKSVDDVLLGAIPVRIQL